MACAEAGPGHRGLRATRRETKHQVCASSVTPRARSSVLELNVRAVHRGSGEGEVTVPGARRGPRPSARLPTLASAVCPKTTLFRRVCVIGRVNRKPRPIRPKRLFRRKRRLMSAPPGGCWQEVRGFGEAVPPGEWLLRRQRVRMVNEAGSRDTHGRDGAS